MVLDNTACARPFDGVQGKTIAFNGTVIGVAIFMGRGIGPLRGHHFTDKGGRKDAFAIEGSLVDEKAQDMGEIFVGNTQTALGRKDGPVGSDFVARKAVAAWCKGRARLAAPEIIDLGNPRSKFVPAASPVFSIDSS